MRYRFGDFEFLSDSFELFEGGEKRPLQLQPARLLLLLLERRGAVLTREEILLGLWGSDHFGEIDSSINFTVGKLRQALADRATEPTYVETLPKLGYRFIADFETDEDPERKSLGGLWSRFAIPRPVAAGALLCIFLVAAVGGAARLWTRAAGSSTPVLEAARPSPTGSGAVRARRLGVDDSSYDRFLRGSYRTQTVFGALDPELYRQGVEDLEAVSAAHPAFIDGRAALAAAYLGGISLFPSELAYGRAESLAEEILRLEPDHPEALVARAEVALWSRWDLSSALVDLDRARQLDPGLAAAHQQIAFALAAEGHTSAALEAGLRARWLDPENLFVQSDVGLLYLLARHPREALEASLLVAATEPRLYDVHSIILWAQEQTGNVGGMLAEVNRFLGAHGALPAPTLADYLVRSRRYLETSKTSGQAVHFSLAEAMIRQGDLEHALDTLVEGCQARESAVLFARYDPRLDPLRGQPGFAALLDCFDKRTA